MARDKGGGIGGGAGCGGEVGGLMGGRSFVTQKGRVVYGYCAHADISGKKKKKANGESWSDEMVFLFSFSLKSLGPHKH